MAAAVLIYTVIIGAITETIGQKVDVEPKVYSYPGQTVDLRCALTDATGINIIAVTWSYEPQGGERTIIAVFAPNNEPSYPPSPLKDRISFSPSPPDPASPSIQISGVKKTDEGNYICSFAVIPGGNLESTTNLELLETIGQKVDVEPKVYSYPGQTVDLRCALTDATGINIVLVTWSYEPKGGERTSIAAFAPNTDPAYPEGPLKGRVSFSPSPPDPASPSIQISGVKKTDEGNYICSFTVIPGGNLENTTNLEMLERIVDASVTPSTDQPVEGNSVNLTCEAAGSVFTRKWMKNGAELTETDNMMFYNESRVLSFLSLKKTDSGQYSCNISNPVSFIQVEHSMTVSFGPENVQIQGPSRISVNEILTLTCSAESTPPPTFTWKLNETVTTFTSAVLRKDITDVSESGKYTCQVMNSITGRKSSAVHELTVTLSPDPPTPPPQGCAAGCIAGIVIGCLVLVAVCVVLFALYKRKHNRDRQKSQRGTDLQQRNNRDPPPANTEQEEHTYVNISPIREHKMND